MTYIACTRLHHLQIDKYNFHDLKKKQCGNKFNNNFKMVHVKKSLKNKNQKERRQTAQMM